MKPSPGASASSVHRVLGIDPSLRSTGYAYWREGQLVTGVIDTGDLVASHRLAYIRAQVGKLVLDMDPTLVVMEDYAMGAGGRNNNNVFKIGELGGVLKLFFWESSIDVLPIPPTVMKSVIALNGRAEKRDIANALASRFDINVTHHDMADATGLMLLGEMRLGLREATKEVNGKAKSKRFDSVQETPVLRGKLKLISRRRVEG